MFVVLTIALMKSGVAVDRNAILRGGATGR
jgi:hypothetical protein